MSLNKRNKLALFFAVFFIAIIATPSIILSVDDKVDVSLFYGENEEEEKENFKLLYLSETEEQNKPSLLQISVKLDCYELIEYPKPSINFIAPPPEFC